MKLENGKNVIKLENGRKKVVTYFDTEADPSLTHQEFTKDCDVNTFIAKQKALNPTQFQQWFNSPTKSGTYADFSELPSYQEALNTIIQAETSFNQLPSDLRQRFKNDPQQLLNYLNDPANLEESIKLGLRTVTSTQPEPTNAEKLLNQIAKNTTPKKPKPPVEDEA